MIFRNIFKAKIIGGGGGGGGQAPTLKNDIIDYWDFYKGQIVGRLGNAIVLGAGFIDTEGKVGYGIKQGSNLSTCASVPDEPCSTESSWTVSFWVKKQIDYNYWTGIGDPHQTGFSSVEIQPSTNKVVSGGIVSQNVIPTNGLTYVHIVVTQQENGERILYFNGQVDSSTTANTDKFRMARIWGSKNYETSFGLAIGASDEIGLWNRPLNLDEISLLYNEGNGLSYDDW